MSALSRDRLYKLVEYISRPPISDKRLSVTGTGQIRVELKSAYKDDEFRTSEEEYSTETPTTFSLAFRLLSHHQDSTEQNILDIAPASPLRSEIVPNPKVKKGFEPRVLDDNEVDETIKPRRLARDSQWAKLLKRTFKIDVSTCSKCGSELRIVAVIMKKENELRAGAARSKRYLDCTGKWQTAPPDLNSPSILADNNITYEDLSSSLLTEPPI